MERWDEKEPPLVSVCCITYNHANYIHDAVLGFLDQMTNFPIEILIHDDASTDGTEEIIREYESKYPQIIKPLYETENQYVKGRKGSRTFNIPRAQGKYIALCEGDDYWTDPFKLQKQVDFLEANPDYILVHSDGDYHFAKNGHTINNYIQQTGVELNVSVDCFVAILQSEYPIITCSVVFRSKLIKFINMDELNQFGMGDTFLWLEFAQKGKFHFFNERMVARNILIESISQSKDYMHLLRFKKFGYELAMYFMNKYKTTDDTKKIVHEKFNRIILKYAFFAFNPAEAKKAWTLLNNKSKSSFKDKIIYFGTLNTFNRFLIMFSIKVLNVFRKL